MMVPREHGAYGQLLFPVVTAMALGRPSVAALAVAAGAVAAFVAHEPLLVLLGRRGARLRRAQRNEALRWLVVCGSAALVLGATGVALLPASNRWTVSVPLVLATVAAVWVARGKERSTSGEVLAAATLSSVSFPVAVASFTSTVVALTCALAFTAGFSAATVSVRAVIREAHSGGTVERVAALGTAVLLPSAVALLVFGRVILPAALWAAVPMCGVALGLVIAVPRPHYLRQVGWTLVGASALTGIILLVAVR